MAWEYRGSSSYYYRKKRIGKKVVSEYIGKGPLVEEMARADTEEREKSKQDDEKQKLMQDRDVMDSLSFQADQADSMIRRIVNGVLIISGYHKHKGQWRRKRDAK